MPDFEWNQPTGGYEGDNFFIDLGDTSQLAWLAMPENPQGIVVFCQATHAEGAVASFWGQALVDFGIATLLFELLQPFEASLNEAGKLAIQQRMRARTRHAIDWVAQRLPGLPIAVCGLGPAGMRAALTCSADPQTRAVVISGVDRVPMQVASGCKAPVLLVTARAGGLDRNTPGVPPIDVLDDATSEAGRARGVAHWLLDRFAVHS